MHIHVYITIQIEACDLSCGLGCFQTHFTVMVHTYKYMNKHTQRNILSPHSGSQTQPSAEGTASSCAAAGGLGERRLPAGILLTHAAGSLVAPCSLEGKLGSPWYASVLRHSASATGLITLVITKFEELRETQELLSRS